MTVGPAHEAAKARWRDILDSIHYRRFENTVDHEFALPSIMTDKGPKQWKFDVYCEDLYHRRIAIEVDGKKGHSSHHNFIDDTYRDRYLL